MKLEILDSYPNKMSSDEIQKVISECIKQATHVTKPDVNVTLGANYYISMIELGQTELNKRIQSGLMNLIEKQNKAAKRASIINWILTCLIIVLALVTLQIGNRTLGFAQSDQKSDEVWQMEQIELLKKQNAELIKLNKNLIEERNTDSIK
jgi:hypothetical protein